MIYAVDFDGYLCEDAYPEIGKPRKHIIEHFKALKAQGHKLILWTCREGQALRDAVNWCLKQGLHFDAYNSNLPEMNALYGNDCRKVGADWYCDDRNYTPQESVVKGVSPDAEIITNEKGGMQSKTAYGFHLIDTDAILALAEVLQYGATKYAPDNWRMIPSEEHFNHMMIHYYAWLKGDRSDDHLGHMFCRAMMLYATAIREGGTL